MLDVFKIIGDRSSVRGLVAALLKKAGRFEEFNGYVRQLGDAYPKDKRLEVREAALALMIVGEPLDEEDPLDRFDRAARKTAKNRNATRAEIVEWVTRNLYTPVKDLDPKSCPSVAALSLLRYARQAPKEWVRDFVKGTQIGRVETEDADGFGEDDAALASALRALSDA